MHLALEHRIGRDALGPDPSLHAGTGPALPAPRRTPPLDPSFRPAVLANALFRRRVEAGASSAPVTISLEQPDGSVFEFRTAVFADEERSSGANYAYCERLLKFLLWSRGGFRVHLVGPPRLCERLREHYARDPTGTFDAAMMGQAIYGRSFELLVARPDELPEPREAHRPLGRHLDGCRIGFDLGASDRKIAAVVDGEVVYSAEVEWNPAAQADPGWHFDQVMESLRAAAARLPRVDAIGGSAAGVYVDNEVRVASLFRGVPRDLFETRIRRLFMDLQEAWGGIPFVVVNDGEVTALAGSMLLDTGNLLGIALGSSQAAGYVTADGSITSWLNELAFAPVDHAPNAPLDEWSGDRGCGVQYFSQQGVARLLRAAGIEPDPTATLPQRLLLVQELMGLGDDRAERIYRTIGTYLGYSLAHYAEFYRIDHALLLGRVMTGPGGDVILEEARACLDREFPALSRTMSFYTPGETEKRHGQAVAAASLPAIGSVRRRPAGPGSTGPSGP